MKQRILCFLTLLVGVISFSGFAQVVDEDYFLARSLSLTFSEHQNCGGVRLATRVNGNYTVKQAIERLGKSKKIDCFQERFAHRQFFLSRALFSNAAPEVVACFLENGAHPWISVFPKGKKPAEERHVVVHAMRSSLPYEYLNIFFEPKVRSFVFPNGFFQAQSVLEQAIIDYPSMKSQKMRHVIGLLRIWAQDEKIYWNLPLALRKILPKEEYPLVKKSVNRLIDHMKKKGGFGLEDKVSQGRRQGKKTVRELFGDLVESGELCNPPSMISGEPFPGFLAFAVRRMASKEVIRYLLKKGVSIYYPNVHTCQESHIIWVPIFFAGKESMLLLLMSKDMRGFFFPNGVSDAQKLVEQYKKEDHSAAVVSRIKMFEALVTLWAQEGQVSQTAQTAYAEGFVSEQDGALSSDDEMVLEEYDDNCNTPNSPFDAGMFVDADEKECEDESDQMMDLDEEVSENSSASADDAIGDQDQFGDFEQKKDEDLAGYDFVESSQEFFDRDLWKDYSRDEESFLSRPTSSVDGFSFGLAKDFLGDLVVPDKKFENGDQDIDCDFWKVSF